MAVGRLDLQAGYGRGDLGASTQASCSNSLDLSPAHLRVHPLWLRKRGPFGPFLHPNLSGHSKSTPRGEVHIVTSGHLPPKCGVRVHFHGSLGSWVSCAYLWDMLDHRGKLMNSLSRGPLGTTSPSTLGQLPWPSHLQPQRIILPCWEDHAGRARSWELVCEGWGEEYMRQF